MSALALAPSDLVPADRGRLSALEGLAAAAALSAMSLLPITEMISRQWKVPGIPGSTVFVQQLTLWIAFLGAVLAARSDRLMALSANTFLPERWIGPARVFVSAVGGAIAMCLAWAGAQFVNAERLGGGKLAAGIPLWIAQAAMPAGFFALALGIVWHASPDRRGKLAAALGLGVPCLLGLLPSPHSTAILVGGIVVVLLAALLGLPIFATLGGIALLLFWNEALPVAAVPVETYRLVASPVLPSIPLFTFAGYLLVEGGANHRLLRVYQALLGWMPGGLAVTTAVVCAIFTWAGSGVTILAMGGLMLPMLLKARYPENFSIGLINASGSLGLLFPPSLPVILYGVYARTPIDQLFVGGFLPGLLMVTLVSAWGVYQGVRNRVGQTRFSRDEAVRSVWAAKWELAVPAIVLVGLFGGFGTLVEAGAITVAYAFVVECLVYKGLSARRDYAAVAKECVTVVGGVLLIVGVAVGFTNYLVDAQLPGRLIEWTQANIHSKYLFLLLLNILLLLKGSFMDVFSAIIVVVPLITPIAAAFGIEPVQLGIIFLANLELGYLTPPVGMNLCLSAYRFRRPMASVYRATVPFYLILLGGVLLITYVPWITMAPVRWFYGK
jgi:tripartite ATP-independent transporter DctM subunit